MTNEGRVCSSSISVLSGTHNQCDDCWSLHLRAETWARCSHWYDINGYLSRCRTGTKVYCLVTEVPVRTPYPSVFRVCSWITDAIFVNVTQLVDLIQLVTYRCTDASFTGVLENFRISAKNSGYLSKFPDISIQLLKFQEFLDNAQACNSLRALKRNVQATG